MPSPPARAPLPALRLAVGVEPATLSSEAGRDRAARPLRVLQVYSVLGVGGAETWLVALLRHIRETGAPVEIDVCLTGEERGVLEGDVQALGARLHRVPFGRRHLPAFARGFREVLRTGRYDAVHDHQDYVAGLHFLAGAGVLPPVRVAHVHNAFAHIEQYHDAGWSRQANVWLGQRLLARFATHIAGTSEEILRTYGFDHARYSHLWHGPAYCGFDVGRFQGEGGARASVRAEFGWDTADRIVLFAGRLNSHPDPERNQKNPHFALDVARACVEADPGVRVIVAGDGEIVRADLEARVNGWGLAHAIQLPGTRPDIPRLMQAADLLLIPSRAEGLGMVAVEAQAAGLPVLASTAVPREAAVVDGMVTFLPLDAGVTSWADRALAMLCAPRPDAASANDAVAQSAFSIENSVERLIGVYRGGRPPGVGAAPERAALAKIPSKISVL